LNYSYKYFYKLLDKGFIEIICPQNFSMLIYKISIIFSKKQLAFVYHLNFLLILGSFMMILIILIF
jgi:hypothetical protein